MNQSKLKILKIGYAMAGVAVLTCLDQFTKYLAVIHLKEKPDMIIIPGMFQLTYLENRGAAWGMLENMQWIFLIATAIIGSALIYYYVKSLSDKKLSAFRVLSVFLLSGAIGNAIDRVVHGYVIDFLYVSLINFPVFNVADCFVTISIFLFLVIYRKEVAQWIRSE